MSRFCQNCGSELKEGANVCINCGRFLVNETKLIEKKQQVHSFSVLMLVSSIFFMISLFSLLNSYGLGDVFVPSWSDYYWFYTNESWAVVAIVCTAVTTIMSIITLIFGIKKSKTDGSVNHIFLSIFHLSSTVLLFINTFISYGNSMQ